MLKTTLLSISIVDVWLLYKQWIVPRCHMNQATFYKRFAEQLIDNNYNNIEITRKDHHELCLLSENYYKSIKLVCS